MPFRSRSFHGLMFLGCLLTVSTTFGQTYKLREPATDGRTLLVDVSVSGEGTLKTPAKEETALELPLELKAETRYYERRLPSAGRDARAWRAYRLYDDATSKIKVKSQTTDLQLSSRVRDVICEGQRKGVQLYTPNMPMRRNDLDLLTAPGDSIALLALLPSEEVEVGEKWVIPDWAGQMFAGLEAATSVDMSGKLLEVKDGIAVIQIEGSVKGATAGSAVTTTMKGKARFDVQQQLLTGLTMTQDDERSISTVSPGMNVNVTVEWTRKPSPDQKITDDQLESVPFDPPEIADLLLYRSKHWNINLIHDRTWYIFQEIPDVTVLRMVREGSLISQCNIAKISKKRPGEHVSPEKFEADIRNSLGDSLASIVDKQEVSSSTSWPYIYRVVASGSTNGLEMIWIYYLCAAGDGRQVSFVFAVEADNIEILNSRDLSMVESIEFEPVPEEK